jgi:outer membrane protein assembly factor BamE (lipoprotein component of BamABCDE complex)
MTDFKTGFSRLFTVIILLTLAGCQTVDVRGQFVSDEAINEINIKKPGKNEVIDMIGTPTYIPDYTKNTWYYIQRSLSKRAWFDPKVVKQRVVKIMFNSNSKVLEAVLLEDLQNENITALGHYTKTYGTEQSGIQKFVKNIGRFNQTTNSSNRRKKKK